MATPFQVKLALGASSANVIAHSQSPAGAGPLTLTGAVVTLDAARRVLITSGSDDSGITFTVTGTNRDKNPLVETLAGGAGVGVNTTQDFLTVSSIVANGSPAGTVEAGTSGVGSSQWYVINQHTTPINIGVGVVVSGTINFTVEYTYDNINAPFTGTFPTVFSQSAMASKSANTDAATTFAFPIFAIRLTQNSFSTNGTAAMIVIQSGLGFGN